MIKLNRQRCEEIVSAIIPQEKSGYNTWETPVLIGDVFAIIHAKGEPSCVFYNNITDKNHLLGFGIVEVCEKWKHCGFTKSLQRIMECGFEEIIELNHHSQDDPPRIEQLKDENARKLFEFLDGLFPKTQTNE